MPADDLKSLLPSRIETDRLVLRPPMRCDLHDLVAHGDNPHIARMLKRFPSPYTRADAIGYVDIVAQRDSERCYCVTMKRGTFIGCASFFFADGHAPEVGYWFGEAFWGRGFASEAVAGMVKAARSIEGLSELGATALAHNYASARVLEKAGFTRASTSIEPDGPHAGKSIVHFRLEMR